MTDRVDETRAWQAVTCPACGGTNLTGTKFCGHCGRALSGVPAAPAVRPPAAPPSSRKMGLWGEAERRFMSIVGLGLVLILALGLPLAFTQSVAGWISALLGMGLGFWLTGFGVREFLRKEPQSINIWSAIIGFLILIVSAVMIIYDIDFIITYHTKSYFLYSWLGLIGFEMAIIGSVLIALAVHLWTKERVILKMILGTVIISCMLLPELVGSSLFVLTLPLGLSTGGYMLGDSMRTSVEKKLAAARVWGTVLGIASLAVGVSLLSWSLGTNWFTENTTHQLLILWSLETGAALTASGVALLLVGIYVWVKRL
ncbi:MAG: hypothetical protein QXG38_03870 [Candidatus Hadarchaeales archaeon]